MFAGPHSRTRKNEVPYPLSAGGISRFQQSHSVADELTRVVPRFDRGLQRFQPHGGKLLVVGHVGFGFITALGIL